jgi:muramoyltetrapeptide carboxypeptidase
MRKIHYPPRLRPGDTVGLVAPASPPDHPEKVGEGIIRLIAQGFRVRQGKHLDERAGYLAGSDEHRAADINAFLADPEVRAIWAVRGGYGSCRILPLIDYAAARAHPKAFIGYSDITALHHALFVQAGLVTFHGPNVREAFLPGNMASLGRMFFDPVSSSPQILFSAAEHPAMKTVVPGRARGRLLGGNLTCLLRLLGTPYAPDFKNAILFLEDIGEKTYRLDGAFTHLRLAGILGEISGLVLGHFDHNDAEERGRIEVYLQGEAEAMGVPCVSGAPIGHFPEQVVLPVGVEAELDADAKTLSFENPGAVGH